jgi:hypothetical protein
MTATLRARGICDLLIQAKTVSSTVFSENSWAIRVFVYGSPRGIGLLSKCVRFGFSMAFLVT